jgi:putative heme-binding domain-containing protein
VRVNALRLAESRLDASMELRERVRVLVGDPDPHVRLQLAFAIGETRAWNQAELLSRVVAENLEDTWIRSAVLSSTANCAGELLTRLAGQASLRAQPAGVDLLRQLTIVIGAQNRPADVARALDVLAGLPEPLVALPLVGALGEGLARGGTTLAKTDRGGRLRPVLTRAQALAADGAQVESLRRAAIEALAQLPYAQAAPTLLTLISATQSPALQLAAIGTLGKFRQPEVGPALLERYAGLGPVGRKAVLEAVLTRAERIHALWPAIERGVVRPQELTAAQLAALRRHADEPTRRRAVQLLGAAGTTARAQVYRDFLPALQLPGAAARGRAHFEARCAACHRYSGKGYAFGPDLDSARSGGLEKLLTSIVDPNRDVSAAYYVCQIETRDGESFGGLLKTETATTVTLLQPGGVEKTVPRAALTSLRFQSQSLMPEGLEAGMSPQDMADLLAFLKDGTD